MILNNNNTLLANRLPNNISISFNTRKKYTGEQVVSYLSTYGIYCSTASACSINKKNKNANTIYISHVLKAINLSLELAKSTIRLTISKYTTSNDLVYIKHVLTSFKKSIFINHNNNK